MNNIRIHCIDDYMTDFDNANLIEVPRIGDNVSLGSRTFTVDKVLHIMDKTPEIVIYVKRTA